MSFSLPCLGCKYYNSNQGDCLYSDSSENPPVLYFIVRGRRRILFLEEIALLKRHSLYFSHLSVRCNKYTFSTNGDVSSSCGNSGLDSKSDPE